MMNFCSRVLNLESERVSVGSMVDSGVEPKTVV